MTTIALRHELGSCTALPLGAVTLQGGPLAERAETTRRYLQRLEPRLLLQNHLHEAGLWTQFQDPEPLHGGWERPTSQLRGHFLGHWLSASAWFAVQGDGILRAKVVWVVDELRRCQQANGDGWVFGIPPRYLDLLARGRPIWAPQYTIHKTLMGLWDAWSVLGLTTARELVVEAAAWFGRWSATHDDVVWNRILDNEAGGMLEVWTDLAEATGDPQHRALAERCFRAHLFPALQAGHNVLADRHANAMVPEVIGALRAEAVFGGERWAGVADGFAAMLARHGSWVTGGQSAGELWTPPGEMAARLGAVTQEHCVVYNLARLAELRFRRTGDPALLDQIELLTWNGMVAQQHPVHGTATYMLPLGSGGKKTWGSDINHFWCCHGTQVQAHATHTARIAWACSEGLIIGGWTPCVIRSQQQGVAIEVTVSDADADHDIFGPHHPLPPARRPCRWAFNLRVRAPSPVTFTLFLRLPAWLAGAATLVIAGESREVTGTGFVAITRQWGDEVLRIELPQRVEAVPLPGDPERVAFREGPYVLAALCDDERTLHLDCCAPDHHIVSCDERAFGQWQRRWRLRDHERGLRFIPLHEVVDETYAVYVPVVSPTVRA